jgi:hypothetical protein
MLRFLMAGLAAPRSAASFVAVMDGDDFRMGVAATSTFTEEADRWNAAMLSCTLDAVTLAWASIEDLEASF